MVYLSNRIAWAWEAYDELREYGWTFTECIQNLDAIVTECELI